MSLNKYNQKRNFSATAELEGNINQSENELIFVEQKYAASHLPIDIKIDFEMPVRQI
ncbi:hypothetical protein [Flavobacterium urumqiense]|uniref:Bifunctional non-homologous end joining protein LigD n=1 Tax=Flavobacterium urumqiense TaxID=935224 RepID=A0A1H5ZIE5_9FLAO|nr:hypothetical protein [Flavobacterium urumqiense]SEG36012.1 bifunctional non-homologous end joining protein LigD [Flavobacterium urumqiense]